MHDFFGMPVDVMGIKPESADLLCVSGGPASEPDLWLCLIQASSALDEALGLTFLGIRSGFSAASDWGAWIATP